MITFFINIFKVSYTFLSQVALVVKNPLAMRYRFDPWVGKIPWRRAGQPSLVFLPGKAHEQKSLAGYSS